MRDLGKSAEPNAIPVEFLCPSLYQEFAHPRSEDGGHSQEIRVSQCSEQPPRQDGITSAEAEVKPEDILVLNLTSGLD